MNIRKDESRLICQPKWKRDIKTDVYIAVQSDIAKDKRFEEFKKEVNREVESMIVKCCTKYFGKGKLGEYSLTVQINGEVDNSFIAEINEEEEDGMYGLTNLVSYT